MIKNILSKFQSFRNRLFPLFPFRAGATMDLIDAVSAEANMGSIVKLSLSPLFRRKYSSLTDVLSSLFRINLKQNPTKEEIRKQRLKITQLLAEECAPKSGENHFSLFAIDCTANPRVYARKVEDRAFTHAPNHIPGQKPITVGHEYSVLVHLPDDLADQNLHWVVPLSTRRVESSQSGTEVGLSQLEEIVKTTIFKDRFCVNVSDTAYSNKTWIIGTSKWSNVVHIARMRGNRKVYRIPERKIRRGRPVMYGEEIWLSHPSQPDLEEITTTTTKKGKKYSVLLERWKDVIVKGSKEEQTNKHPFDLLRVTVTDRKNKPMYKRPLWIMITGKRRNKITSKEAYISYGRRYDIEHFFRFGKQKLGFVKSQTCETRHEENWHWIGILAYNMLYHARELTNPVYHPWEKRKVIPTVKQKATQVQRDYHRIIRGIGTPAPVPKPRGKSPGRKLGYKSGKRLDRPLIWKSIKEEEKPLHCSSLIQTKRKQQLKRSPTRYRHMRRVWDKSRPPPTRC